jgi:hypothetical protein
MRIRSRLAVGCVVVTAALSSGSFTGAALAAPKHDKFGDLSQPQPTSNADGTGNGANPGTDCEERQPNGNPVVSGRIYCSMRNGSASLNGNGNGNGNGNANGRPCAGCVGRADNKNPPGQGQEYPTIVNGRLIQPDKNNGYECDGNNGIGKTNPAHTLCDP